MSNRLHKSCLPGGILPAVVCAHPFPLRSFQKEEEEEPHPYFSVALLPAAAFVENVVVVVGELQGAALHHHHHCSHQGVLEFRPATAASVNCCLLYCCFNFQAAVNLFQLDINI